MFIWTIGDALGIAMLALIGLVFLCVWTKAAVRTFFCKHDGSLYETMACDAICNKCGKNLGFIGAWREKRSRVGGRADHG